MVEKIAVLGATGSIGDHTLDILKQHPHAYQLVAFSANKQVDKSFEIIKTFRPQWVVMVDERAALLLQDKVRQAQLSCEILTGPESVERIASLDEVDIVVAAIVGGAGLPSALAAAKSGKKILLANKEALVMSGDLFLAESLKHGAQLLPVDSEHNALFQCMPQGYQTGVRPQGVDKIILTASGGPFLNVPFEYFDSLTPEQAVKHPKWSMGQKISVDSATLVNKGLEVIEAHYMFQMPKDTIDVVIHPQSVIHSMVCYQDGSTLAQMGTPDMRIPISACLSWPERIHNNAQSLDFTQVTELHFSQPDHQKFPSLTMCLDALETGLNAPLVLNACNEIAVQAFLRKRIRFTQIPHIIEYGLNRFEAKKLEHLDHVFELDAQVRDAMASYVEQLAH